MNPFFNPSSKQGENSDAKKGSLDPISKQNSGPNQPFDPTTNSFRGWPYSNSNPYTGPSGSKN